MIGLRRQLALLVCALQFLTRLPVPPLAGFQADWINRSARYFPVAGQSVGLICAGVWLLAGRPWPGAPAALLAVGAGVLVTGGFHEDGLADTADGLGGGATRVRRLEIMKDSRIGSFGALALLFVTGLRVAALARMSPWAGALSLVAAHGAARAAAVVAMAALPYAGDAEVSKVALAAGRVSPGEAAVALMLGLWPLLLTSPASAGLGVALAATAALVTALTARRLIGGVTGDVLGAVEQLAETGLLLGLSAFAT